jgi:hypothetical protein
MRLRLAAGPIRTSQRTTFVEFVVRVNFRGRYFPSEFMGQTELFIDANRQPVIGRQLCYLPVFGTVKYHGMGH